MSALLRAVAEGKLTPTQGSSLAGLVEVFGKTLEIEELERRLVRLEERDGR